MPLTPEQELIAFELSVLAPQFAGTDNSAIVISADRRIQQGFCGDNRVQLVALLAAHLLDIANKYAGAVGGISSVTEGGSSITYGSANNSKNSGGYYDTNYGRQYLDLLKTCDVPVRTRVEDVFNDC